MRKNRPAAGPPVERCANCGAALAGRYCSTCGERKLDDHEHSLRHFLSHSLHEITHFDTKLFMTLRPLLFRPGFLTREHLAGRRTRYLKPLQLFVLLNILFFLVGSQVGLFAFQFESFVSPHSRRIFQLLSPHELAGSALRETGLSEKEFAERFDREAEHLKKSLIFVMIPFFAAACALLFASRRRYFVEHLTFAIHFYGFWLVMMLGVPLIEGAVIRYLRLFRNFSLDDFAGRVTLTEDLTLLPVVVLSMLYLYRSSRVVYESSRTAALAQALVLVVVMFGLLLFYRDLLFVATLKLG